jgi:hypothetical protein
MFLQNTYKCKKALANKNYVDCVYWNINTTECKAICSLKIINSPTVLDCSKCPKRKSYNLPKIEQDKEITSKPETQENLDVSFAQKTKNYIKAESSQMFSGKVSQEVYEKRKSICMSCEFKINEAKENKDEIGWCKGGCGCMVGNPRSALSQKLYMPTLSCPKGKFGIEKGTGFNVNDAVDSAKGLLTSVSNLLQKDK